MKNYRNFETIKKATAETAPAKSDSTAGGDYIYYSKVLKTPFNTVADLKEAEAAYYAEIKAKEDKAAQKKADAAKVENAFKALNVARRKYKADLVTLTQEYSEGLAALKKTFEDAKEAVHTTLATAEEDYSKALKAFTEKYPEGYHLTLKDGDFETTISSKQSNSVRTVPTVDDIFTWLFG
jgi:DNA repair ATPase RecN